MQGNLLFLMLKNKRINTALTISYFKSLHTAAQKAPADPRKFGFGSV
jgi:hypothetical protein